MFTDQTMHKCHGPTMGTRWSASFSANIETDLALIETALQAATDEVDAQMSTWKPDSDLMRLNAAPIGQWITLSTKLMEVLQLGMAIGKASHGAFDIGMGDAVTAWGFGPNDASAATIRDIASAPHVPAHKALEIDTHTRQVCKRSPITLDLNGIAKGYGVDCLAEVLKKFGITSALLGIDGEMRAIGTKADGKAWTIAVEAPDPERRAAHSILALEEAAVATSGDYRHWVEVEGRRLSHTMNPQSGKPALDTPASVTVVAKSCAEADAWATALMVLGSNQGQAIANQHHIDALFLLRAPDGVITEVSTGRLFSV